MDLFYAFNKINKILNRSKALIYYLSFRLKTFKRMFWHAMLFLQSLHNYNFRFSTLRYLKDLFVGEFWHIPQEYSLGNGNHLDLSQFFSFPHNTHITLFKRYFYIKRNRFYFKCNSIVCLKLMWPAKPNILIYYLMKWKSCSFLSLIVVLDLLRRLIESCCYCCW